jgi:hypothetical protein
MGFRFPRQGVVKDAFSARWVAELLHLFEIAA